MRLKVVDQSTRISAHGRAGTRFDSCCGDAVPVNSDVQSLLRCALCPGVGKKTMQCQQVRPDIWMVLGV